MKGRELYAGPDEQQGLSHFRKFLDEYILALILIPLLLLQAAVQCSAEKPLAKHFVVESDKHQLPKQAILCRSVAERLQRAGPCVT